MARMSASAVPLPAAAILPANAPDCGAPPACRPSKAPASARAGSERPQLNPRPQCQGSASQLP
eukprot:6178970-Alexandrium_andersonii.AAC.1